MKRRWPIGVLRPRVKAYRNDGGKLAENSFTCMLYSLDQLLTKCSGELSFPGGGARRIFTIDGREVTKLENFADEEIFEGGVTSATLTPTPPTPATCLTTATVYSLTHTFV